MAVAATGADSTRISRKLADVILSDLNNDNVPYRIRQLSRFINQHLDTVDQKKPQCRFFSLELRNRVTALLNSSCNDDLALLIPRVKRAIDRLDRVQRQEAPKREPPSQPPLDRKPLFERALRDWLPKIFSPLLYDSELSLGETEALVSEAFTRRDFEAIATPIMYSYFKALSGPLQDQVIAWINQKKIPEDPQGFETMITTMISSDRLVAGAFNHLLDSQAMGALPQQVLNDLFRWADQKKDDQLIFFLLDHRLVNDFFNEIVEDALTKQEFHKMEGLVCPDYISLLTPETGAKVADWEKTQKALFVSARKPAPSGPTRDDIHSLADEILADLDTPDIRNKLSQLCKSICIYLEHVDKENQQCHFFTLYLRSKVTQLLASDRRIDSRLVREINKAVHYLTEIQNGEEPSFSGVSPSRTPHPECDEWIATNHAEALKELDLEEIDSTQRAALFDWACQHWEPKIFLRLLRSEKLPIEMVQRLVSEAFKQDQFGLIIVRIMRSYFKSLPPAMKEQITDWMVHEKIPKAQEEFEALIRTKIGSSETETGDFNHLLHLEMMQALPEPVREQLFRWAHRARDGQLIFFMLTHRLIGRSFFSHIVVEAIDKNQFAYLKDWVFPENVSLLTSEALRRVLISVHGELRGIPEEDEKIHPNQVLNRLIEVTRQKDWSRLFNLIESRSFNELGTDELFTLAGYVQDHPEITDLLNVRLNKLYESQI